MNTLNRFVYELFSILRIYFTNTFPYVFGLVETYCGAEVVEQLVYSVLLQVAGVLF
jgi:hypothetical protein